MVHQEGSIKIVFFLQHLGLQVGRPVSSLNPQSFFGTHQFGFAILLMNMHIYIYVYIYCIYIYIHIPGKKNATRLFGTADCLVSRSLERFWILLFHPHFGHPSLWLRHCKTRLRLLLRQLLARHGQERHMLKIASSDSKYLDDTPQPELHLNLGGIFMEIICPWAQDKLIPD